MRILSRKDFLVIGVVLCQCEADARSYHYMNEWVM